MNLPVRPPTLPSAFPTRLAAPLNAGPAAEVTLDSPSEAFEVAPEATSLDLAAALEAASVVEAFLRVVGRAKNRLCRIKSLDAVGTGVDISPQPSRTARWDDTVKLSDQLRGIEFGDDGRCFVEGEKSCGSKDAPLLRAIGTKEKAVRGLIGGSCARKAEERFGGYYDLAAG